MKKENPSFGSSLDDFLAEEGLLAECQAEAIKRVSTELVKNPRSGWENPAMWTGADDSSMLIDDTLTNTFDREEWYW